MGHLFSRQHSLIHALLLLLAIFICTLPGCGASEDASSGSASVDALSSASSGAGGSTGNAAGSATEANVSDGNAPGAPVTETTAKKEPASAVPRKIIYDATVELVAENLSTAQQKLMQILKKHKGFIAETNVGGYAGSQRSGTWKIRIPVDQFDACMADISKLGALQSTQTKSQDVTAEYYDVQARITNKQVEEKRLLTHLQRSTAKLQDILMVERELSRVRGEIESMQGRLRVLSNLTSLTTITVSIRETKEYVPPRPTTFGERIALQFHTSMVALRDVLQALVLVIVAFIPWIIIAAPIALVVWLLARRARNKQ